MWGLLLIVSCAFSLSAGQSESLSCIGRNEELACVKSCPPEHTCRTRGILLNCLTDDSKCVEKCVCKDGYYRNTLGDCISDEECDKCPGKHEFFACGPECDNVCAELSVQNRTNCPIVNIVCNQKCYCEDGFARDDKNECIPVEDCRKCGPNEFLGCVKACPPDTCTSLVAKFRCRDEPCQLRCRCKPGYLRLMGGTPCIPYKQCPQINLGNVQTPFV